MSISLFKKVFSFMKENWFFNLMTVIGLTTIISTMLVINKIPKPFLLCLFAITPFVINHYIYNVIYKKIKFGINFDKTIIISLFSMSIILLLFKIGLQIAPSKMQLLYLSSLLLISTFIINVSFFIQQFYSFNKRNFTNAVEKTITMYEKYTKTIVSNVILITLINIIISMIVFVINTKILIINIIIYSILLNLQAYYHYLSNREIIRIDIKNKKQLK